MDNNHPLKEGTTVSWSSQAMGHTVPKTGKIICVVPAGVDPFRIKVCNQAREKCWALPNGVKILCSRTRYGGGLPRKEPSYIVLVKGQNPDAAESYYWPRTKWLQAETQ